LSRTSGKPCERHELGNTDAVAARRRRLAIRQSASVCNRRAVENRKKVGQVALAGQVHVPIGELDVTGVEDLRVGLVTKARRRGSSGGSHGGSGGGSGGGRQARGHDDTEHDEHEAYHHSRHLTCYLD